MYLNLKRQVKKITGDVISEWAKCLLLRRLNGNKRMKAKSIVKGIMFGVAGLIGVCVVTLLLLRFVFREEAVDWLAVQLMEERVELLRTGGVYGEDEAGARLHFRYVQDSVQAQKVRTYFRLDTIWNPKATTWENALKLAAFVSRNVPHANQQTPVKALNAIALWDYHLHTETAFNCRWHSILFHELLLSMGITNRFVTCMPADSTDRDCHVVNLVWLPEQDKWAMLDTDQGAYAVDAQGIPLSLEEMRQRLVKGEPITYRFFKEEVPDTGYYASYWAKNLFWFACWEETGYDKETTMKGTYVYLLPQGFRGFKMKQSSAVQTSDAARFWAKPEQEAL